MDIVNKALIGFKDEEKVYGTKPIIPDYPLLDVAQGKALTANIAAFEQASKLAVKTNLFNSQQLSALADRQIGGGAADQIGKNILSMLRGEIPDDTATNVLRTTAGDAFGRGIGGQPIGLNFSARSLGLESNKIKLQGFDSALKWLSQTPMFDITSAFITPQQQFGADQAKFERDLLAAKVKAAPDPVARGAVDTFWNAVGMVAGAVGGYMGGGGGVQQGGGATGSGGGAAGAGTAYTPSFYMPQQQFAPSMNMAQQAPGYNFSL